MNVVCLGKASYDITMLVDSINLNKKNKAIKKVESSTVNAANLLGCWGIPSYFLGVIGNDHYGQKIEDEFIKMHVYTKYLEKNNKYNTPINLTIIDKNINQKTIFNYGEDKNLTDLNLSIKPDIVFTDGYEYEMSKELFSDYKDAVKIIDANVFNEDIVQLCTLADYIICTKEFAEKCSNTRFEDNDKIISIFNNLKKQFNNNIVIILEDGYIYEFENIIKMMPNIKIDFLTPTSNIDIFHGAFIYGIIKEWELEKKIKCANIARAIAHTKSGSRNSIPTRKEMKMVLDDFE